MDGRKDKQTDRWTGGSDKLTGHGASGLIGIALDCTGFDRETA